VSRLCLDTSAYSHFRRGDPAVVERLDAAVWIGLPAVVIGELEVGFLLGSQTDRNQRELTDFIAHPVVEVLDVTPAVARVYGEIVTALRRAGTPLPTNDLWIAATAVSAGATILTYNSHFRLIDRVGSLVLEG
jgi:predicted nucleic acid-binding protein